MASIKLRVSTFEDENIAAFVRHSIVQNTQHRRVVVIYLHTEMIVQHNLVGGALFQKSFFSIAKVRWHDAFQEKLVGFETSHP